jgi:hypothetical protein
MNNQDIAHIFWYRWPRIQEGLEHTTKEVGPMMPNVPEGAYAYYRGVWYVKARTSLKGERTFAVRIVPEHVPKEIRTLALIVT